MYVHLKSKSACWRSDLHSPWHTGHFLTGIPQAVRVQNKIYPHLHKISSSPWLFLLPQGLPPSRPYPFDSRWAISVSSLFLDSWFTQWQYPSCLSAPLHSCCPRHSTSLSFFEWGFPTAAHVFPTPGISLLSSSLHMAHSLACKASVALHYTLKCKPLILPLRVNWLDNSSLHIAKQLYPPILTKHCIRKSFPDFFTDNSSRSCQRSRDCPIFLPLYFHSSSSLLPSCPCPTHMHHTHMQKNYLFKYRRTFFWNNHKKSRIMQMLYKEQRGQKKKHKENTEIPKFNQ